MHFDAPPVANVLVLVVAVTAAMVVDVRTRRIPNVITFPTIGAGFLLHSIADGGAGALAALFGAFAAPFALLLVRGFRPLGMGDVKLAAAVGSLLGPAVGVLAMLVSAIAGGLVAIAWALKPGNPAARTLAPFLIGVPFLGRIFGAAGAADAPEASVAALTIPYGIAIGIGSLLTLGVVRWI